MTDRFPPGTRVRVKRDFPHTLPHFARVHAGVVDGHEGKTVVVRFDEERNFPIDPEWLELAPEEPDEDEPA
ncbi:MAG: hypothetical protein K8H88_18115 [Sandaracinaceae bacterium]|nr:hypothetical protein [Sandaracinaceae bacterium]